MAAVVPLANEIDLAAVPDDELRAALKGFDFSGDNRISADELRRGAQMVQAAHKAEKAGETIPLALFPAPVRKSLELFDADGSGDINATEIAAAARMLAESKTREKKLKKALIVVSAVAVALLAVMFGVTVAATFVAVQAAKDMRTSSSAALTTLGGQTVRTAGAAMSTAGSAVAAANLVNSGSARLLAAALAHFGADLEAG